MVDNMRISYLIYLLLCAFSSVVCHTKDIHITDWQYWAILFSIIIAWICGQSYVTERI